MEFPWNKKIDQLRRVVLRKVKNPADAEDIVQDTVTAAVERGGFGTESHLSGFLSIVLRNKVADYFRKIKTNNETSLPETVVTGEAQAGKQSPAKEYETKEFLGQLQVALESLGEEDRCLIELMLDEHPTEKICERLSISVGALRVRRFRLAARIRQLLARNGVSLNTSKGPEDSI